MIQPLFSAKHLAELSVQMVGAVSAQLESIAAKSKAGPLNVEEEMLSVTSRLLMETIFGTSVSSEERARLGRHLKTAFRTMSYGCLCIFLPAWVPRPGDRAFFGSIAALDEALLGMLAARRAKPTDSVDLMNRLIAAQDADTGETMSDRHIRDELINLFVASLDTTSVTLTWMLWLLETHPEANSRLRAEVSHVLGGRAPTAADLRNSSTPSG